MDDDSPQPESSKTECSNTPTKPRASVGQPDTPSTATKKKTRTTIYMTIAQAGAGKTAAQRSELTDEQLSAVTDYSLTDIMDKIKSSPLRMKEQGLIKVIFDCKDTSEIMTVLHDEMHALVEL